MLSLPRLGSQLPRRLTRAYAQVTQTQQQVNDVASGSDSSSPAQMEVITHNEAGETVRSIRRYPHRIPVREDHGLYGFFRRKPGDDLVGEDRYEVFETPESGQVETGRAWLAAELRNKSFKDLHTLWYVALREQNVFATQKEEARRFGAPHPGVQIPINKLRQCRKTMARIKLVLNERRLAYEGARKLAEEQYETLQVQKLQEFLQPRSQASKTDSSGAVESGEANAEARAAQPELSKQHAV